MQRLAVLSLMVFLALLAACSSADDMDAARAASANFHSQLDAGQFDQIWEASGVELKNASSQQDFTDLLEAVHRKLGQVSSTKETHWGVRMVTAGTFIDLAYSTTFEGGAAVEQLVWHIDAAGKALLVGYHINSNALITKDLKDSAGGTKA